MDVCVVVCVGDYGIPREAEQMDGAKKPGFIGPSFRPHFVPSVSGGIFGSWRPAVGQPGTDRSLASRARGIP